MSASLYIDGAISADFCATIPSVDLDLDLRMCNQLRILEPSSDGGHILGFFGAAVFVWQVLWAR
jgi:hypothetical protein